MALVFECGRGRRNWELRACQGFGVSKLRGAGLMARDGWGRGLRGVKTLGFYKCEIQEFGFEGLEADDWS